MAALIPSSGKRVGCAVPSPSRGGSSAYSSSPDAWRSLMTSGTRVLTPSPRGRSTPLSASITDD